MLRSMAKYSRATGPHAAAREAARSGSRRTLRIPSASGPAATGVSRPRRSRPGAAGSRRSRSPRSAGRRRGRRRSCSGPSSSRGRRAGDGPGRRRGGSERDDLLGGLAGQDDQSIAVPTELGAVTLAGLGRAADQDAAGVGPRSKTCGSASIRIGTPWLGWTMLPTYMMTLCSGPTPGIAAGRRAARTRPGRCPGRSRSPGRPGRPSPRRPPA